MRHLGILFVVAGILFLVPTNGSAKRYAKKAKDSGSVARTLGTGQTQRPTATRLTAGTNTLVQADRKGPTSTKRTPPMKLSSKDNGSAFSMARALVKRYGTAKNSGDRRFLPTTAGANKKDFTVGGVSYQGSSNPKDELVVSYFSDRIQIVRNTMSKQKHTSNYETFRVFIKDTGAVEYAYHSTTVTGGLGDSHPAPGSKKLPGNAFVAKNPKHQAELDRLATNPAFAAVILGSN